jgi:hypothetical protein
VLRCCVLHFLIADVCAILDGSECMCMSMPYPLWDTQNTHACLSVCLSKLHMPVLLCLCQLSSALVWSPAAFCVAATGYPHVLATWPK